MDWKADESFRAGFLSLRNIDVLGQINLCCGGYAVHCGTLSSIPGSTHYMAAAPSKSLQPKLSPSIALSEMGNEIHCQLKASALELERPGFKSQSMIYWPCNLRQVV